MLELPTYISVLFILLVFGVLALWIIGINKACALAHVLPVETAAIVRRFGIAAMLWLAGTGAAARAGFYLKTDSMPPKILLVVGPALIAVLFLTYTKRTRQLLVHLPNEFIVRAQSFRIAVEVIFYLLLLNNAIPALMTFEGRNMDIFVGLTALPVAMLIKRGKLSDGMQRIWNYAGLAILLNVMIHGLLSAPSPMQQITTVPVNNFMLHFPYVWLIGLLVPTALAGHLLSLRHIAIKRELEPSIATA